jgi:hypothetical protein
MVALYVTILQSLLHYLGSYCCFANISVFKQFTVPMIGISVGRLRLENLGLPRNVTHVRFEVLYLRFTAFQHGNMWVKIILFFKKKPSVVSPKQNVRARCSMTITSTVNTPLSSGSDIEHLRMITRLTISHT